MIYPMYINGKEHLGDSDNFYNSVNPSTGKSIGTVVSGQPEDVDLAVNAAQSSTKYLSSMTVFERAEICFKISESIERHKNHLARMISLEQGKPLLTESLTEIDNCILAFKESGEQIKWVDEDYILPTRDANKRVFSYRRPRGVYGIITPWNGPLSVACNYYVAPGIASGNSIVWVPSPSTSIVSSEFIKVINKVIPPGAINLITGKGAVVGDALVVHPLTNAIGFTGSSETGCKIDSRASGKPCLMELGGNGPTIVMKDADIETAADKIFNSSFINAGQICTSTERVLVDNSIADDLVIHLEEKIKKDIRLGNPLNSETTMGPVHDQNIINRILGQIEDAKKNNSEIIIGGENCKNKPTNLFMKPTIIDYVKSYSRLHNEEIFGPVIPIIRYDSKDELDNLIYSSPYIMSCSIFTKDTTQAMLIAEQLRFSLININEASNYWEKQWPVGGASGSLSGYGRVGGKYSIKEMTEIRTIVMNL